MSGGKDGGNVRGWRCLYSEEVKDGAGESSVLDLVNGDSLNGWSIFEEKCNMPIIILTTKICTRSAPRLSYFFFKLSLSSKALFK